MPDEYATKRDLRELIVQQSAINTALRRIMDREGIYTEDLEELRLTALAELDQVVEGKIRAAQAQMQQDQRIESVRKSNESPSSQ